MTFLRVREKKGVRSRVDMLKRSISFHCWVTLVNHLKLVLQISPNFPNTYVSQYCNISTWKFSILFLTWTWTCTWGSCVLVWLIHIDIGSDMLSIGSDYYRLFTDVFLFSFVIQFTFSRWILKLVQCNHIDFKGALILLRHGKSQWQTDLIGTFLHGIILSSCCQRAASLGGVFFLNCSLMTPICSIYVCCRGKASISPRLHGKGQQGEIRKAFFWTDICTERMKSYCLFWFLTSRAHYISYSVLSCSQRICCCE